MEKTTIKDCYHVMNVKKIIYIEDEIECENKANAFVSDLLKVEEQEQKKILNEISEIYLSMAELLEELIVKLNQIEIPWETLPKRNIERFLKTTSLDCELALFERIEAYDIDGIENIIEKYGLGIKESTVYLKELAICLDSQNKRIPLRIYRDFTYDEQISLKNEINECISEGKSFVCIIDDQLGQSENCSKTIIDFICDDIKEANKFGAFILLSSKGKKEFAKYEEGIYVDYVEKEKGEPSETKVVSALIRSKYSGLLNKLKAAKISAVEEAYKYAFQNKDIAVYLAEMAKEEGITNLQILEAWLELQEKYYWKKQVRFEEKREILSLSSLLGSAEFVEKEKYGELEKAVELSTFEQYDYEVNTYYESVRPGDIFMIGENYYLLIGQECDFSLRKIAKEYRRKNQECVLLQVDILEESYVPKRKYSAGFNQIILNGFKTPQGEIVSLRINYNREVNIEDVILDICSYRSNGEAILHIKESFEIYKRLLITNAMRQRYNNIRSYFEKHIELFWKKDGDIILKELLVSNENYIISKHLYEYDGEKLYFPVKRICRLKRYIELINKYYADYKWRMAMDTIYLDDIEPLPIDIYLNGINYGRINAGIILINNRDKNKETRRRKWFVGIEDMKKIFEDVSIDDDFWSNLIVSKEYYVFDSMAKNFKGGISYRKSVTDSLQYNLEFTMP